MADVGDANLQLTADFTAQQYAPPAFPTTTFNIVGDSSGASPVTTINGNSGQVVGPSITISGGSTGYDFQGSSGTLSLVVGNAATVRSSISAAKSGVNADISQFTGLTGNTGFNAWTGTPDQTSHATFSGTASVGYVQAELQAVMDSLQQATGLIMALLTALLANGVIET
jgi:hypothetical protein